MLRHWMYGGPTRQQGIICSIQGYSRVRNSIVILHRTWGWKEATQGLPSGYATEARAPGWSPLSRRCSRVWRRPPGTPSSATSSGKTWASGSAISTSPASWPPRGLKHCAFGSRTTTGNNTTGAISTRLGAPSSGSACIPCLPNSMDERLGPKRSEASPNSSHRRATRICAGMANASGFSRRPAPAAPEGGRLPGPSPCDEYLEAFSLGGLASEEHAIQPADQVRRLRIFAKDGTTWIICPALGGSAGLISQVQLDAFGKLLGTRLTASDFKHCPDLDPVDNAPRAQPEVLPDPCRRSQLPADAAGCHTEERLLSQRVVADSLGIHPY